MAVIDIQKELGVLPDGWYGEDTHTAYLASGKKLGLNFAYLRRKLQSSFDQSQVDGMYRMLDACNKINLMPQHAAYILATNWHETGTKMQPVSEVGKGRNRRYGRWMTNSKGEKYCYKNGNRKKPTYYIQSNYDHFYYGRGESQLTWWDNYKKASNELGIDFLNNPDLALVPENSANILVTGSMQGWFTTRSIPQKISYGHYAEFVAARSVINGSDKADDIAKLAKIFLTSLELV